MAVSADSVLRLFARRERFVSATFALARAPGCRSRRRAHEGGLSYAVCEPQTDATSVAANEVGAAWEISGARFELGDRVRVCVSELNLVQGWIDFALLENPSAEELAKNDPARP